ncbi:MAG: glycoside hydrolase family 127 protein, partial [Lentisphaeria bacterium]|nr:glycoside hydrolase family 127 protein [Lentisphaeria bacterium]
KITVGYPAGNKAVVTLLKNGEFELALRIPRDFGCRVDGQTVSGGTYHVLKRQWQTGDRIELEFDFSARTEKLETYRADLCGPLVMCRERGEKPGRGVLRSCGEKVDYASAGMDFTEGNTLTVWENTSRCAD